MYNRRCDSGRRTRRTSLCLFGPLSLRTRLGEHEALKALVPYAEDWQEHGCQRLRGFIAHVFALFLTYGQQNSPQTHILTISPASISGYPARKITAKFHSRKSSAAVPAEETGELQVHARRPCDLQLRGFGAWGRGLVLSAILQVYRKGKR